MTIHNAVIRNNTAGGLGGGVAGCIHGSIADLSATGAAIYGNTAQGVNFTQPAAGAAAADDKEIVQAAMQQGAFSAADAMDLFSAGNGAHRGGRPDAGRRKPSLDRGGRWDAGLHRRRFCLSLRGLSGS